MSRQGYHITDSFLIRFCVQTNSTQTRNGKPSKIPNDTYKRNQQVKHFKYAKRSTSGCGPGGPHPGKVCPEGRGRNILLTGGPDHNINKLEQSENRKSKIRESENRKIGKPKTRKIEKSKIQKSKNRTNFVRGLLNRFVN